MLGGGCSVERRTWRSQLLPRGTSTDRRTALPAQVDVIESNYRTLEARLSEAQVRVGPHQHDVLSEGFGSIGILFMGQMWADRTMYGRSTAALLHRA